MNTRNVSIPFRRKFRNSRLAQIALIYVLWLAGEGVVRLARLPIPGGIVGMIVAYVMLASQRVSTRSMRRGAQWYIGDMLLFFIPAVPAVMIHPELLGWLGVKIVGVIFMGTIAVMCVTALTVDIFYRLRVRHDNARLAH